MTRLQVMPWLTCSSIGFLRLLIADNPRLRVLEFGAGGSTLWFADRRVEYVRTIEHSPDWYHDVLQHIEGSNVDLRLLPRPYDTAWQTPGDEPFDLVLVDGRDRVACATAAYTALKPGGVLMLDNAERGGYQPIHARLKSWDYVHTEQRNKHPYYPATRLPWSTDWWIKPQTDTEVER